MAKIRHIAITSSNPKEVGDFFREAFEMTEVRKSDNGAVFLSDGYINLAVLKFKDDDAATTEGKPRYTGIHHFGVEVEDMGEARARIENAGAKHRPLGGMESAAPRQTNMEVKFLGPDGVTVDLSETGWVGTSGS